MTIVVSLGCYLYEVFVVCIVAVCVFLLLFCFIVVVAPCCVGCVCWVCVVVV